MKFTLPTNTPSPRNISAAMNVGLLQEELNIATLKFEQRLIIELAPGRNRTPNINLQVKQIDHKKNDPWEILAGVRSLHEEDHIWICLAGNAPNSISIFIPSRTVIIRQFLPDRTHSGTLAYLSSATVDQGPPRPRYLIITDSFSVLTSMETGQSKSRPNLLQQTLLILQELGSNQIQVEFLWGPSHINLPGNDKADMEPKL
ncbi:hypothetical protein CHS0354_016518 [Potamilus streckersoni]|uniref:RNase H type-1 domain-containing protein n=1 Tax=Potamilus streckersoni TaxID=2493646 RepID=A0AAE0RTZ1_9BIVA|nr:hypothetical protein CHS0354_016518 [Potamilus streckersoni]